MVLNNDNAAARRLVEHCYTSRKTVVNPIIEWSNADVWSFIRAYGIRYNPLYDEGFGRVGCIGCPMAGKQRYRDWARWPKYRALYVSAFDRMLAVRHQRGLDKGWATGEDVMTWWMEENPDQISFGETNSGAIDKYEVN